ncbi:hypothetical protein BayCH28_17510 [Mycolicibacterium sp. CH28]|uniref:hypothetical protein n=1 Tax=Mycolicibacterium sp. CH28 TaxID=2512237 RepID=UPI0010812FEA|nr:hypothetical protein [Mycolicibacterium sp. CH28]TGD86584.1 hypothetical protein BayCH28_17510 [Mycolicibacterium sp. CH28]
MATADADPTGAGSVTAEAALSVVAAGVAAGDAVVTLAVRAAAVLPGVDFGVVAAARGFADARAEVAVALCAEALLVADDESDESADAVPQVAPIARPAPSANAAAASRGTRMDDCMDFSPGPKRALLQ